MTDVRRRAARTIWERDDAASATAPFRALASAVVINAVRDLRSRDPIIASDAALFFMDFEWAEHWLDMAGVRVNPLLVLIEPLKERQQRDVRIHRKSSKSVGRANSGASI